MITDRNQVCFAKISVCGVQEVLNSPIVPLFQNQSRIRKLGVPHKSSLHPFDSVRSASVTVLVIRTRKSFFGSKSGKYLLLMTTLLVAVATSVWWEEHVGGQ
jgi:hypothetical protein